MLENDLTLAAMAEALAKSADYRVLRRLVPRKTALHPSVKVRRPGFCSISRRQASISRRMRSSTAEHAPASVL